MPRVGDTILIEARGSRMYRGERRADAYELDLPNGIRGSVIPGGTTTCFAPDRHAAG